MTLGILLAFAAAAIAFGLARAKTLAYALLFLAFLPFMTLDPSAGGLVSMSGLDGGDNVAWKVSMRALSMGGILLLALRKPRAVLDVVLRPACLPVLALFLWALIGLPRASDPWVAFFRLGELFAFFVTGVVLYVEAGRDTDGPTVLRWHALAVLPLLGVTIVFAFLHPEIAFHESSAGIRRMGHKFMNSNVLGFAATAVGLWGLFVIKGTGRARTTFDTAVALLAIAAGAFVMFHARSRTAMLTAALGTFVMWFPWPHARQSAEEAARRRLGFAAFAAVLGLALLAMAPDIQGWFLRGASVSDVASGTGRTGLWADLVELQVPKAPWLGAGYLNLSSAGGFEHAGHQWNNAHSAYLFALVSTGFPGLLCVLFIVGLPIVCSARRVLAGPLEDRPTWTFVLAIQSTLGALSITSFGVIGYPNVAMLFHYALYAWTTQPLPKRAAASVPDRAFPPARSIQIPAPPCHRQMALPHD